MRQAHGGQDIIVSTGSLLPASLVFSPLVFAVWKERAQVLLRTYGRIDWPGIHDALILKNGWSDIGGQANWGQVKFGQTRPDQSNSGLLSITLLAYAFYKEQRDLTVEQVRSSAFLASFSDVEGAVTQFGRSSGTYLENEVILKGPAAYDITTTYENLVLTLEQEAMQRQGQLLPPFYPGLNIVSDHPFAILQGQGNTPETQLAAKALRDFLLAEPQQRQALLSGFRPTNPNVTITDTISGNPFLGQSSDIQLQAPVHVQTPPGPAIGCSTHSTNPVTLTMYYGSEKQEWINDVVPDFNSHHFAACDGAITVRAIPIGSGQSMQEIVDGTIQPDIWSPAGSVWLTLLNSQWQEKHGSALISTGANDTPSLLSSSVVIAMWKPMAQALGWPNKPIGWADIAKLSLNPQGWAAYGHPEFGAFKFGHTHPDYSNSGLDAIIAMNYAAVGKVRGLTTDDVNGKAAQTMLSSVENAVIHYGDSTGFFADKMFNTASVPPTPVLPLARPSIARTESIPASQRRCYRFPRLMWSQTSRGPGVESGARWTRC